MWWLFFCFFFFTFLVRSFVRFSIFPKMYLKKMRMPVSDFQTHWSFFSSFILYNLSGEIREDDATPILSFWLCVSL